MSVTRGAIKPQDLAGELESSPAITDTETAPYLTALVGLLKSNAKDIRASRSELVFAHPTDPAEVFETCVVYTVQVMAPDDSRYKRSKALVDIVRRGITLVRWGDRGVMSLACAMRKFFYTTSEELETYLRADGAPPAPELPAALSEFARVSRGGACQLYYTRKENGELVRVTLLASPVTGQRYWCIASKNVPLLLRFDNFSADMAVYQALVDEGTRTFSYALIMARRWDTLYNNLTETQQELVVKVMGSGIVFVGEFVGGVDQHFVHYKDQDLCIFSLVNQARLVEENCLPTQVSREIVLACGMSFVQQQQVLTVDDLGVMLKDIAEGDMDEHGEGAVFYTGNGTAFKYKSMDYSFARKRRTHLVKIIDTIEASRIENIDALHAIADFTSDVLCLANLPALAEEHTARYKQELHLVLTKAMQDLSALADLKDYVGKKFLDFSQEACVRVGDATCVPNCVVCGGTLPSPSEVGPNAPFALCLAAAPGSGKTTVLRELQKALEENGIKTGYSSMDELINSKAAGKPWEMFKGNGVKALRGGARVVLMDMCFAGLSAQKDVADHFKGCGFRCFFRKMDPGAAPIGALSEQTLRDLFFCVACDRVLARTTPESCNNSTLHPGQADGPRIVKVVYDKSSVIATISSAVVPPLDLFQAGPLQDVNVEEAGNVARALVKARTDEELREALPAPALVREWVGVLQPVEGVVQQLVDLYQDEAARVVHATSA